MTEAVKENILGALETVIDPELGIDIVNLGLVYSVDIDQNGKTLITMTLTSIGCPMAGTIVQMVKNSLTDLPEVKEVDVEIVWDPPWTKDRMSRYAKIALGVHD